MAVTVKNDAPIYFRSSKVVRDAFYQLAKVKGKNKGDYLSELIKNELRANGVEIVVTEKIV